MNKNLITKIIGVAAMGLGFIATAISNWASDRKMIETVREEVDRQLSEKEDQNENEDEES